MRKNVTVADKDATTMDGTSNQLTHMEEYGAF